jgi:bifunctional non-homologous end joining protein LigD
VGSDRTAICPFADLPTTRAGHWGEGVTAEDLEALIWVEPRVVVEVSFVEWPPGGLLRHSEFVGLRDDKNAEDMHRDFEGA